MGNILPKSVREAQRQKKFFPINNILDNIGESSDVLEKLSPKQAEDAYKLLVQIRKFIASCCADPPPIKRRLDKFTEFPTLKVPPSNLLSIKRNNDVIGFMKIASKLDGFSLSPRSVASLKSINVSTEVSEKLNDWLTTVPVTEQVPLGLFSENKEFALPDKAPELYSERADKKEDAISFFKRVYKPWLDKGIVIYQDNLRGKNGLDRQLMIGITNKCKQNKAKIASIVPPKSARVSQEVHQAISNNYAKTVCRIDRSIRRATEK